MRTKELAVSTLLSETKSKEIELMEQTEAPLPPTLQVKYASTAQLLLQPSPFPVLPSSHP